MASIFDRVFKTLDATPTFSVISEGGVDVPAGQTKTICPALPGRTFLEVNHSGTDGRLWIGLSRDPAVGIGGFLDAGQLWFQYYNGAFKVFNSGSNLVRATYVEWGM